MLAVRVSVLNVHFGVGQFVVVVNIESVVNVSSLRLLVVAQRLICQGEVEGSVLGFRVRSLSLSVCVCFLCKYKRACS